MHLAIFMQQALIFIYLSSDEICKQTWFYSLEKFLHNGLIVSLYECVNN